MKTLIVFLFLSPSIVLADVVVTPEPQGAEVDQAKPSNGQPKCLEKSDYRAASTIGAKENLVRKLGISNEELIARVAYADTMLTSRNCKNMRPQIAAAIVGTIVNRVRRDRSDAPSVVFKRLQFGVVAPDNVSPDFLCPKDDQLWASTLDQARKHMNGEGKPAVQKNTLFYLRQDRTTRWARHGEEDHTPGVSGCVHFYTDKKREPNSRRRSR